MDKLKKMRSLMDNERNFALYTILGLTLAYLGLNFPLEKVWIIPLVLAEIAAVITVAYGVWRYIERRRMIIDEDIKFDEKRW